MIAIAPVRRHGESMDTEKEIIEHKATAKMLDAKLQAVINLLTREGMFDEDELQDEINRLIKHEEHRK